MDIIIPFPSLINPELNRSRPRHYEWVGKFGLLSSPSKQAAYEAADFPRFVAKTYPLVRGLDLDLITDFIGWSWLFDDHFDRPGVGQAKPEWIVNTLEAYRAVLHGATSDPSDPPLVVAWRDLLSRLDKSMSKDFHRRHIEHWEECYWGFYREAENNVRGVTPTFEEYLIIRRGAAGVSICLNWGEAVGHFEVPPSIYVDPMMLSMRTDTEDVVNMTNDLFSVRKEATDGNTDNIVLVLAYHEKCSWSQAEQMTKDIIRRSLNRFLVTEEDFLRAPSFINLTTQQQTSSLRYIESLKHWMKGSLDWHLTCPRYH